MLHKATQTIPWTLASFLLLNCGFGQEESFSYQPSQECSQPCDLPNDCDPQQDADLSCDPEQSDDSPCEETCPTHCSVQLVPGYNYPARLMPRCPWNVNVLGGFLYWQPTQENMELGVVNTTTLANLSANGVQGDVIEMNFHFKPGFQAGLGLSSEQDGVDFQTLYTWLHFAENTFSNGLVNSGSNILPISGMAQNSTNGFNTVNQSWRLKMDLLDATLGRWSYLGENLTYRPYFGARTTWIRQQKILTYVNDGGNGIGGTVGTQIVNNQTVSWGIGPEIGLHSNWSVGEDFRFFGNGMIDVVYTRYSSSLAQSDTSVGASYLPRVQEKGTTLLKTHFALELGIGWAIPLDCNDWYLDLLAGYTFQAFKDQNMFRCFKDPNMPANSQMPNGDLYIQGLTASIRLDF